MRPGNWIHAASDGRTQPMNEAREVKQEPCESSPGMEPVPSPPLQSVVEMVRARTPARILTGRAGAAYRTSTYLELRRDHAAALDAVCAELDLASDLGAAFLAQWG